MTDLPIKSEELLTEGETAIELKLAPATLAKWRMLGKGPRYCKMSRSIRYPRSEIERFKSSSLRSRTAEVNGDRSGVV